MEQAKTSNLRAKRWLGAVSTMGATMAVLIMVLAPASAASSGALSLKHDTMILDYSGNIQGCAHATNSKHTFSLKTGDGAVEEKASATTCPKGKGGFATASDGSAYTEFGVTQSYNALPATYHYLNSTWNISALVNLSAVGSVKNCPYQTASYFENFYNGTGFSTGWFNETYQSCYAEAYIFIDPQEDIDDQTTGQYWGFGFSGFYASAGAYADNYTETFNYTTAGWTNTTYSCTTCYGSYGPGGSTTVSTTVYGNVTASTYGLTWTKGDRVTIYAEAFVEAGVELQYAKNGVASSTVYATGPHGHVDLKSFGLA